MSDILKTVADLKALNEAKVEIRVQYKDATQGIFMDIPRDELVMRIQPDEAVYLKMNNKLPGFHTRAVPVELDLTYKKRFTDVNIPQAYEALILDALKGDHSNFVRDDELDVAWKIFTPILHWIDSKGKSLFLRNCALQTGVNPLQMRLSQSRTPMVPEAPRKLTNSRLNMDSSVARRPSKYRSLVK